MNHVDINRNTVIEKFENSWVVWFKSTASFALFEAPAYDVFEHYTAGSNIQNIVAFCEKKYGHIEKNISAFVNEIIERVEYLNTPENKISVSANCSEKEVVLVRKPLQKIMYEIGDKVISVAYPNEYLKLAVHPVIAHLEIKNQKESEHLIELLEGNGKVCFRYNGKFVDAFKKENIHYFTGSVKQQMYSILYNRGYNSWAMSLHASGVVKNEQAIVFSANAGSGKSTISALLKAFGYKYLSDDFITVDENGNAYPFPAAISVKEGTVKTLSEFYPRLSKVSSKEAFSGKKVKYIPVENLTEDFARGFPVKAFVFVKYNKQGEAYLENVNKKEALKELLKETWVNPEPENIKRFFNWIKNAGFYRLQYANTPQALEFVQTLFKS
ncbi:MAG: hypothetical protein J7L95_06170 [Prolixibacteraceae bacterium]|nr:hypothetical protein [Prolixibacteraceae bacterium]